MKKIKNFLIDLSKKNTLFRKILRKTLYIKNYIIRFKYRFEKVDDNLIIFESYMGRNYSCSPKAIYEEMIKNEKYNNFKFMWAFKNPEGKEKYFNHQNTKIVKYRSNEYYKLYGQAKYFVTNSRLPEDIFKKKNQIYVQCWHGTPLKRLGCDIVDNTKNAMNTKKEIVKRYTTEAKKMDYFLSPSKFASTHFISAFNLKKLKKENIILELGYPRNDYLINYSKKDVIKIKKSLNIPLDKKVIFYAPTWRDNQHKAGVGYIYNNILDFDFFKKKIGDEYVILYRPHYLATENFDYKKYHNFVIDITGVDDINNLYIISDALITDYSSVLFDYAVLKRPMIFYMYDKDEYEKDLRGFYLDIKELPGKIVTSEKQIINILKDLQSYNKKYEKKYKKFNDKFNYLDNGEVSKKVIEKIFNK